MKTLKKTVILIIFFLFILITASSFCQKNQLNLKGDAGYLTKKNAFDFMVAQSITDTSHYWSFINENDTIGKYFRKNNSSNYIACLYNCGSESTFEYHNILELDSLGRLIKYEKYTHGNYPICWENYYGGFDKYGEYYGINICGTGSGYSASYLCLFKEISPKDSLELIPSDYWSSFSKGGLSESLNSTMDLKGNVLMMHYTFERGKLDDNSNFKAKTSRKFSVKYFYKNKKWTTKENYKFKGLYLWL